MVGPIASVNVIDRHQAQVMYSSDRVVSPFRRETNVWEPVRLRNWYFIFG